MGRTFVRRRLHYAELEICDFKLRLRIGCVLGVVVSSVVECFSISRSGDFCLL